MGDTGISERNETRFSLPGIGSIIQDGFLASLPTDSGAPETAGAGAPLPLNVVPLPSFPRTTSGPRLFEATLPEGMPEQTFFSENSVPLNSVVLNVDTRDQDATTAGHIARAAIQANPDIAFITPTRAQFDSIDDPAFLAERQRIAEALGVPEANVFPVRADTPSWPQDDFMAGSHGLVKPLERASINRSQRTDFGPNQIAAELGLPSAGSAAIARGGDTHVIERPDGQQAAYFSGETIDYTARTHGFAANTPANQLRAMSIVMRSMEDAGVPMENVMPLGRPEQNGPQTYGEALAQLTPEERRLISPDALRRFEEMKNLPFPAESYAYHTDVMSFTADGKTMFVRETDARDPGLEQTLNFFGYDMVALPSGPLYGPSNPPAGSYVNPDVDGRYGGVLNYSNMVTGVTPDGRTAIMMPTEAMDPENLTERDQIALQRIQEAIPDALIIPIGGRSAITGQGRFLDGHHVGKDWGTHCMSNVLPYVINPVPRPSDENEVNPLLQSSYQPEF